MHAELRYEPGEQPETIAVIYEFDGRQRATVDFWQGPGSSLRVSGDPMLMARALSAASDAIIKRLIDKATADTLAARS